MEHRFAISQLSSSRIEELKPGDVVIGPTGKFSVVCAFQGRQEGAFLLRIDNWKLTTRDDNHMLSTEKLRVFSKPSMSLKFGASSPHGHTEFERELGFIGIDQAGPFALIEHGRTDRAAIVDLTNWSLDISMNRANDAGHWLRDWKLVVVDSSGGEIVILARQHPSS